MQCFYFSVVMSIDKSWIGKPLGTPEYENGIINFLNFAFEHQPAGVLTIKCPCSKCGFKRGGTWDEVYIHLKKNLSRKITKFGLGMVKDQI